MPTDPTPTAADFEAARDLRNVVHRYSCGTVGIDVVDDALARAIATAREAGQDVEVGRRRRLIDRARADGDAAGYARGREEGLRLALLAAKGGASDYLGGYRTPAELEIYRHGMGTIINVLGALQKDDPADYQTRACVAMGRALAPPPTPEPTPSRRALPEQREWVPPGERDGGGS